MRSRDSTSLTSWTERSWPTASGVTVFGNATVSFSGSTGSASGSVTAPWPRLSDLALPVLGDLDHQLDCSSPPSPRGSPEIGTLRASSRLRDRQLDAQDAVLVGGARRLGVDVDAELDLR